MAAAGFIDVEFDSLTANGTLGMKGVKSLPPHQFYEFHKPYRQVSHAQRPTISVTKQDLD